jgi:endonuclease YncB( thermonuclease family)
LEQLIYRLRQAVFALGLICTLTALARAEVIEGRVVGIADGDTITVLDASKTQYRIRLQGIDAPESHQGFGAKSKHHLSDLVYNREVSVEWNKRDRYGRIVGKVFVASRDAGLEQIRAGMAWHYKYYQREQSSRDRRLYENAEQEARAARRGLWSDPNPIPPWDFRRGGRGGTTARAFAESSGWWQAARELDSQSLTVYVTRTGYKYHRSSCQYLRRSRYPMALAEARKRYSACSVCRPPN